MNRQNIADFVNHTGVTEVHLSAKQRVEKGMGSLFAASYFETDVEEVKEVSNLLM